MPTINEPTAGEPYAQDDKEDVEGHGLAGEPVEPTATDEESDDVEGHVLGGEPAAGEPTAG